MRVGPSLIAALFLPAASLAGQSAADQAEQLFRDGKFSEAVAVAVPAAGDNQRDARLALIAGQSLLELGAVRRREGKADEASRRTEEGVKWLELAIKLNPADGAAHRWLGIGYGRQAQNANKLRQAMLARKAKSAFETAVRLDTTDLAAHEALMQYYMQAPGIVGGSMDKAKRQARIIERYDRLRGLYAMASIHLRERDSTAALARYREAAEAFPDSEPPNTLYAAVLGNLRRFDDMWVQVDRVTTRWPDDPRATFAVGRAAAVSGQQLERGAAAMRAYLASGSTALPVAAAHYRLAMILALQGDRAGARAEYETVLRLDPANRAARAALDTLK